MYYLKFESITLKAGDSNTAPKNSEFELLSVFKSLSYVSWIKDTLSGHFDISNKQSIQSA